MANGSEHMRIHRDLLPRRALEPQVGARTLARLLTETSAGRAAFGAADDERDLLEAILRHVGDGITVQGSDGGLVYANDAAARLIGFESAAELLATPVTDVLARFEIFDEDANPLPPASLPGRRVLEGAQEVEATVCYRIRATGETRWTRVHATPILGASGRISFAINVFHDVTPQKRAEERARFMATASRLLNQSLDYEQTLADLGRLTVPALADFCLLDTVEADGSLRQVVLAHVDSEKEAVLNEIRHRYGVARNEAHPATRVLSTGEPVVIEEMRDEILAASAFDERHLELYRRLELGSYVVVPLVAHGRTVGTISLGTSTARRLYDQEDVLVAQELAGLAAVAVENARIHREVERRADAARALQFVGDGVVLVDPDGLVRLWNPAAEAVTGVTAAEVVRRRAADAVPGWERIATEAPVVAPTEGATARPRVLPLDVGEREIWLSILGVTFDGGTVFAFRDVTEERALDRLKSDFVATVSHELRTPLAAVYGAVQTLSGRSEGLTDRDREALIEMIASGAERLARIVEDILVAGQLESGRLQLAVRRCDVVDVARAVLAAARVTAPNEIVFRLVSAPDLPSVLADPDKVSQVLANLVDNAVKYSPEGGPVEVRLEENGAGSLRVSVSDEGLGIPGAERERVFEKFYRLDPNLTRGVRGTGLGLYVCRELVTRMGGRIWAEPRRQGGSTFAVELPLAEG